MTRVPAILALCAVLVAVGAAFIIQKYQPTISSDATSLPEFTAGITCETTGTITYRGEEIVFGNKCVDGKIIGHTCGGGSGVVDYGIFGGTSKEIAEAKSQGLTACRWIVMEKP